MDAVGDETQRPDGLTLGNIIRYFPHHIKWFDILNGLLGGEHTLYSLNSALSTDTRVRFPSLSTNTRDCFCLFSLL